MEQEIAPARNACLQLVSKFELFAELFNKGSLNKEMETLALQVLTVDAKKVFGELYQALLRADPAAKAEITKFIKEAQDDIFAEIKSLPDNKSGESMLKTFFEQLTDVMRAQQGNRQDHEAKAEGAPEEKSLPRPG